HEARSTSGPQARRAPLPGATPGEGPTGCTRAGRARPACSRTRVPTGRPRRSRAQRSLDQAPRGPPETHRRPWRVAAQVSIARSPWVLTDAFPIDPCRTCSGTIPVTDPTRITRPGPVAGKLVNCAIVRQFRGE